MAGLTVWERISSPFLRVLVESFCFLFLLCSLWSLSSKLVIMWRCELFFGGVGVRKREDEQKWIYFSYVMVSHKALLWSLIVTCRWTWACPSFFLPRATATWPPSVNFTGSLHARERRLQVLQHFNFKGPWFHLSVYHLHWCRIITLLHLCQLFAELLWEKQFIT